MTLYSRSLLLVGLLFTARASAQELPDAEFQVGVTAGGGWVDITVGSSESNNHRLSPTLGGTARLGFLLPAYQMSVLFAVNGDLLSMNSGSLIYAVAGMLGLRFPFDSLTHSSVLLGGFMGPAGSDDTQMDPGMSYGAIAGIRLGHIFVEARYQVLAFGAPRPYRDLLFRQLLGSVGLAVF